MPKSVQHVQLPRTPAVNTAALPLSNISSSSSSVVAFPAEARRRGAQRQNSWGEHHGRPSRSFIWQCRGRDYRSLISSCLWMRPLLLSLKSTWASLYLVITSTNFLDSTACCAGKKRKKKDLKKRPEGAKDLTMTAATM